jgi:hypothetical protein
MEGPKFLPIGREMDVDALVAQQAQMSEDE